jgi:hypothetical protein
MALVRRKSRQIKGKLRRWFMDKFKKDAVRLGVSERQGECLMCGKCCKLVFNCPFLEKQGSCEVCKIYKYRPAQCRHFPIDHNDLRDLGRSCGYTFVRKKTVPENTEAEQTEVENSETENTEAEIASTQITQK